MRGESFDVRKLTPADQPEWRALRLEALRQYPHAFLTTYAEQRARPAADDRAMLAKDAWRGLYQSNELVGIAALLRPSAQTMRHRAELGALYVTPHLWGKGAAQCFIVALEDEVLKKGGLQMELTVATNNARAIRFYERNGYKKYGTQPRAVIQNDVPQDDAFYVKLLDQATDPQVESA